MPTARTADEVAQDMRDDIADDDPSVDTLVGPVADWFVEPCSGRVSENEVAIQHTNLLYSASFAVVATDEEVEAFTSNYGIGKYAGDFATATQYFCRFTRPLATEILTIPRGTVVTTTAGYGFRTSTTAKLDGSNADSYWNPSSRCYEISVKVRAVAIGTAYNVSAYTITKIANNLYGFDKTENRTAAAGGLDAEDNTSTVRRAQGAMLGTNSGTHGGIMTTVMNYDPLNIKDVSLVFPSDWPLFRRKTYRPALDVYVIGSLGATYTDTYDASGGETEVYMTRVPVDSVSAVAVNGSAATFTFVPDTSPETRGSARAQDKIQLAAPLLYGDVVTIEYSYNSIIYDLQANLFATSENAVGIRTRLFETDVLIRTSVRVPITVAMYARVLSSYDPLRVQSDIENLVYKYVQPEEFVGILFPQKDGLKAYVEANVAGISSLSMNEFHRTTGGTLDIEVIELEKNEEPYVDSGTLDIDTSY